MNLGIRAAEWSLRELERYPTRPPPERIAEYFAPAVRDSGKRRYRLGLTAGNYCVAGACFAVAQVASTNDLESVGVPHAYRVSGLELEKDAGARGAWLAREAATVELVSPGDLVVLSRGDPNDWTRHVGRVVKVEPDGVLLCIDANAGGGGWKIVRRALRGTTVRGFVRYPKDASGAGGGADALALCAALYAVSEVFS